MVVPAYSISLVAFSSTSRAATAAIAFSFTFLLLICSYKRKANDKKQINCNEMIIIKKKIKNKSLNRVDKN